MFGYKLLRALKLCPRLNFYHSVFSIKTYVIIEQIPRCFMFHDTCFVSKALENSDFDKVFSSMKIIHQMRMIHCLFLFNDFHDNNYALSIRDGIVENISIIDIWTCPLFLPVIELFKKVSFLEPESFMELIYNIFNQRIEEKIKSTSAPNYFYYLNLECFENMFKSIAQKNISISTVIFKNDELISIQIINASLPKCSGNL